MPENDEELPFLCVEVTKDTPMGSLAKRFNELFPGKMVRLIVDGEYSQWFYKPNGTWVFQKKTTQKHDFTFKVLFDECSMDYLEDAQICLMESLQLDVLDFRVINDVELFGEKYDGTFYTNGQTHLIDQINFSQSNTFLDKFQHFLDFEIVIDLNNNENTGMCIFRTKIDWLGDIND